MIRTVFSAAALLLLATAVSADEGIPANVLDQMGLSGIEILSDSDALDVRGKGFKGGKKKHHHHHKPIAIAGGISIATVGDLDLDQTVRRNGGPRERGGAGTLNFYLAAGKKSASGDNYSMAGVEIKRVHVHKHGRRRPRRPNHKHKTITTKTYFAGGDSSARAR